jgi:hypothetical protein
MRLKGNFVWLAMAVLAVSAVGSIVQGATFTLPVEGWAVHNGSSTVDNTEADSPIFDDGDNITAMGTFPEIELVNDGDYLTFTTELTMLGRSTTGPATLNTQLRVGLFNGPDGPVVGPPTPDTPNLGFIIEYTAAGSNGGLIREQTDSAQGSPFVLANQIGNGSVDNDTIAGANPPPVLFELTLTRNGGALDLTGKISGGNHEANYSVSGHSSATFPVNGTFGFNRVGLFLGDGVNSTSASLDEARIITNVPEPGAIVLVATFAICIALLKRRASLVPCTVRG